MSSKDEILTAIRQNTVQRYEYPDWEIKATVYPDKISRFYEISQFVGGKAVVLQEAEDINDIIRSHFPEARKIASQMEEITCATIRPDTLAEAQELDGTDVAVVEGAFGVAENGAVWIPQNVKHKALYFIAEALVIVLDRHSLVHNIIICKKPMNFSPGKPTLSALSSPALPKQPISNRHWSWGHTGHAHVWSF